MTLKRDFRLLLKPYYVINVIMSIGYVVAKKTPMVCNFLFPSSRPLCELDSVSLYFTFDALLLIYEGWLLVLI